MLNAVREVARRRSVSSYLVGGCVRDALLGHPSPDLDISIEGDARLLGREAAGRIAAARLTIHDAFRTATLSLAGGHIDLITARREQYSHPGALPSVTPSDIHDDLARRDFTVNAIALGLSGPRIEDVLDPFGGIADLDTGTIRVLHPTSFQDDATRLLRATRYAARFRFTIEPGTRTLVERDRGYLSTISPARVRQEFVRCFAEATPAGALAMIGGLHLAEALVDKLRFTPAVVAAWRRLSPTEWDDGLLPWLLPVLRWETSSLNAYIDRFALTSVEARAVRMLPAARRALTRLARGEHKPSETVACLEPLPPAALLAWVRSTPTSRRGTIAARYLTDLRHVRPQLTSEMTKQLGVREGPIFGKIVRELRAARLDNPALTLDDERRLVQHMLHQPPGA